MERLSQLEDWLNVHRLSIRMRFINSREGYEVLIYRSGSLFPVRKRNKDLNIALDSAIKQAEITLS